MYIGGSLKVTLSLNCSGILLAAHMGVSILLVLSVFVIKGGAGVLFNNTNYNRRFFEAPGIII